MDERELDNKSTIGSVKAAISKYGGKLNQGTNAMKKPLSEKRGSKAQELHLAKKRINQISENKKQAESVKTLAELQLLKAKKTVRELTSQIEESKTKASQQTKELQTLNNAITIQKEDPRYSEVSREVEALKRELSKIKLNIECALEEKLQAEKEAQSASLRLGSYISTAEKLRREIEEANEEELLVELAQIQARKELAAIEAQRKEEEEKFGSLIEEARKKIGVLKEEIERAKEREEILAVTNSEIDVLQNELKLIKEMDRGVERSLDLRVINEDLEAAKKELELIKEGGFKLMGSMDVIRTELQGIMEEKGRIEKKEEETEKVMQNLNSKLLRGKDKLEAVTKSEEKAKSTLLNLSVTLESLEREKEAVKREREAMTEEITSIRAEIQRTECETDLTEEKLQAAVKELAEVKSAEGKALKKLKALIENAVRTRASTKNKTITISRFEHEYLTGCAVTAQEIAEKKEAAAIAWAEASRASEREMKMKTALVRREIEELMLKEEQEIQRVERLLDMQERETTKESDYKLTPVRQAKFRRSSVSSPVTRRASISTSFTMKRRRKMMLRFSKYFASKEKENEKGLKGVSGEEREKVTLDQLLKD